MSLICTYQIEIVVRGIETTDTVVRDLYAWFILASHIETSDVTYTAQYL